jgi:hypothetical protein
VKVWTLFINCFLEVFSMSIGQSALFVLALASARLSRVAFLDEDCRVFTG